MVREDSSAFPAADGSSPTCFESVPLPSALNDDALIPPSLPNLPQDTKTQPILLLRPASTELRTARFPASAAARIRLLEDPPLWPAPLALGQPLSTLPLWIGADLSVPLDLEVSDQAACADLRIRQAG